MKKFSKILSRRLGRRGDDEGGGRWEPGPLESAPDYHQLTSTRRHFVNGSGAASGGFKRRTPKAGKSRILADGSEGAGAPCAVCARIDFAKLLDWKPGDARPWIPLSHCLKLTDGGDESDRSLPPSRSSSTAPAGGLCPWCDFFHSMIGTELDGNGDDKTNGKDRGVKGKFTPYLRTRLAFERLGGGEKHQLGKSVLFEATTRNRSLPWGYIVKVASAPEGQEGNEGADLGKYVGGKGGDAPTAIQGRIIPPLLDPALPKCWIDFCKEHHTTGDCASKAKSSILGLKLVDCEDRKVVLAEDLESAADDQHQNGDTKAEGVEYVTLSYVWGSQSEDESSDQGGDDSGTLPEQLPQLISDAITITKALGFRYLWVDRYCITSKHDSAKETTTASERRRQLDVMGQIYARSALTLIVAAGEGVHDGIPGISKPREEQLLLQTEAGLFTTSLLRPDLDVASSKWASRAWTYQEGLLSRRRLVFTSSQIYFQCQTIHCHESISLPLDFAPGLNLGRVFPSNIGELFQPSKLKTHIKTYMTKSITHNDGRLDAFRGILHEYSQNENLAVDHFLGLPLFHPNDFSNNKIVSQTDRLAVSLGWMPDRTVSSSSHDDLGNLVVDPYCLLDTPCPFPSWTWLAWRLQQGYNGPNYMFNFNLVGETSPLVDGVRAAPRMEISVGFNDAMVLSWEIDGDAIARKAESIAFLRLKTLCFDLVVKNAAGVFTLVGSVASTLGKAAADAIEAWMRRSCVAAVSAAEDGTPVDQEYQLIGVLVSGRNWKPETSQPGGGATMAAATALICGRRDWEPDGQLVRLGALSISYEGLVAVADAEDASIMKNIDAGADERKDLKVQIRELDIY